MKPLIFFLPLCLLLSACQLPVSNEQRKDYQTACLAKGYIRGTPDFQACMEGEEDKARALQENHRIEKRRARSAKKPFSHPGQGRPPSSGKQLFEW